MTYNIKKISTQNVSCETNMNNDSYFNKITF